MRDRHGTGISVKSALSTATGPRLSYLAAISADIEIVSREAGSQRALCRSRLALHPPEERDGSLGDRRRHGKMAGLSDRDGVKSRR